MHDREPCVMCAFLAEALLHNWLDRSGAHVGEIFNWLQGPDVLQHCEDLFQPTLSFSQHPVQTCVLSVADLTSASLMRMTTFHTADCTPPFRLTVFTGVLGPYWHG